MGAPMTGLWTRTAPYAMSWSDFGFLVDRLAAQIADSGTAPDAIVGLARGGLPAAVALAQHGERTPDFYVLGAVRNTSDERYSDRSGSPEIRYLVPSATSLRGRSVLIVDDIVGDGATLASATDHLAAHGPATIRSASVIVNQNTSVWPTFHGCVVDDWVIFPWERRPEGNLPVRPLPLDQEGSIRADHR
ncbi:phosphoribosyltransferase [Kribbella sp. NPDC058245]|uniref:phosphoribosyltransferase n=1 Tax=Kribbella sp. NPDC058245 TaxID=3346399 RepID=UPI0036EC43E9